LPLARNLSMINITLISIGSTTIEEIKVSRDEGDADHAQFYKWAGY